MRCDNCGFENSSEASRCIKCGSPLKASSGPSYSYDNSGFSPNSTVMELGVKGHQNAAPIGRGTEPESGGVPCPSCGYPLMPSSRRCPQCGAAVGEAADPTPKQKPERQWENRVEDKSAFSGTVDPYQRQVFHQCRLVPVSREGEKELAPAVISDKDGMLNRGVVDPDNPTISSKEQACMSYEDGTWYIEDKSTYHTTFIQVSGKQALKQGDVILLGDRRFIFEEE